MIMPNDSRWRTQAGIVVQIDGGAGVDQQRAGDQGGLVEAVDDEQQNAGGGQQQREQGGGIGQQRGALQEPDRSQADQHDGQGGAAVHQAAPRWFFMKRCFSRCHSRSFSVSRLLCSFCPASPFRLDVAAGVVRTQRHHGVAGAFNLADEAIDLLLRQQQLARAHRVGLDVGGGGLQRRDMAADQPERAVFPVHVAFLQLDAAGAYGDFPTFQHERLRAFPR